MHHSKGEVVDAQRFNVYVSVNAIQPGRSTRTGDAIGTIRHVLLHADHDGPKLLDQIGIRDDMPPASYVLESSPDRDARLRGVRKASRQRVPHACRGTWHKTLPPTGPRHPVRRPRA